jgi:hypothetical protein
LQKTAAAQWLGLRGTKMQRLYTLILVLGLSAVPSLARQQGLVGPAKLKVRQKEERQALKLKQKYAKDSLRNSSLPKAVRIQLKHELMREQLKLRQRQRDERQTLKDRERLLKLEMKELQSQ